MGEIIKKLHSISPSLSLYTLINIYKAQFKRMKLLMMYGIFKDIHWLIEA